MASVSVVIPCYNYGHLLDDAVTSVLDDQEGIDVRVLIIDDASHDDSADVARKIADRDPRVEVIVHTANRGHIATYNEGLLEWADGDYSVLMSADDRLTQELCGAPRICSMLIPVSDSFTEMHCGSGMARRCRRLGPKCGVVESGPARGGSNVDSVKAGLHFIARGCRAHIAPEASRRI